MKKNTIILTTGLLLAACIAGAQNPEQERLAAYRIAFITNRLKLTPAEAEKFWPVYNEFQVKKLEIQQERMNLNRIFIQEGSSMNDKQLSEMGDKIIELEAAESELAVKQHETLKGVLPPAKILRLYQAENQYRQQLLKELQQRREQRSGPDT